MSEIVKNVAPNKHTKGNIGDIYINEATGKKYKLVAIYTTQVKTQEIKEYEWREIKTSNGGGSGEGPSISDGKQYVYI